MAVCRPRTSRVGRRGVAGRFRRLEVCWPVVCLMRIRWQAVRLRLFSALPAPARLSEGIQMPSRSLAGVVALLAVGALLLLFVMSDATAFGIKSFAVRISLAVAVLISLCLVGAIMRRARERRALPQSDSERTRRRGKQIYITGVGLVVCATAVTLVGIASTYTRSPWSPLLIAVVFLAGEGVGGTAAVVGSLMKRSGLDQ
jgi:hypothetical protein